MTTRIGGRLGRHRRRGIWSARLLIISGLVLLVAAGAWQGYAWLWTRHSDRVGHALVVHQEHRLQTQAGGRLLTTCAAGGSAGATSANENTATGTSATGTSAAGSAADPVQGLLSIPALHMLAPVEKGDGDGTLAVAVGHIPASVWPGTAGTSILAAHDVSYFVHIDQLKVGNTIDFATPCTTYDFVVTGHQVVKQGSPVYNTPGPTLVLETCWPTDALWFTPDRFLVTATEVGTRPTPASLGGAGGTTVTDANAQAPAVAAPRALVAQGLTLTTNSIPMGTLSIAGRPAAAWVQSPGPLAVESSGLEAFIGGLKAAEQQQDSWWSPIAPGVTMPGILGGAQVTDWHQGLDVSITTDGTTPTTVILTSVVTVSGGTAPGLYDQRVVESIVGNQLSIQSWQLQPYSG